MSDLSPLRSTSPAVADYAKAIFALQQLDQGKPVSTTALATRLNVTAGSVSGMLKRLDIEGIITREPYYGVGLTARGEQVALELLRHHRLLELYLVEHLGVSPERAHDEAEVLEHAISEELEEKIAQKLGDPTHDPHGSPIPSENLQLVNKSNERKNALHARMPFESIEPLPAGIIFLTNSLEKTQIFYEQLFSFQGKISKDQLHVDLKLNMVNSQIQRLNFVYSTKEAVLSVTGVTLTLQVQSITKLCQQAAELGYEPLKAPWSDPTTNLQRCSFTDPNGILLCVHE